MAEEILIPLIVFTALGVIVVSGFHFGYKKQRTVYDAIKVAIEKTGTADPQLVNAIIRDNIGPNADLRKGIILIAIAAAFVILGFSVDEAEAIGPMLGVASFPGLVGLAYVVFHFFAPREPTI